MKQLNDEQMDRIIKEKFKQDNIISDKANSVFANFNPQNVNQTANQTNNEAEEKTSIKEEINNANKNVMNALFYKRLNKFLSVAAVSLTVVLVGGTTLYINRDKIKNNPKTENETSIYTKSYVIKNEPLHYSNEQLVKEIENHCVKAYLVGNSDVGVEFLHDYWDQLNKEVVKVSSETYKIDGINGKIKDIFVGNAVNSSIPYLFILMEDGTAMYVDLHGYYGYVTDLYYYAVPLEGLTDIVGFEEKTRNFSYSATEYTYVNAIRSDGKRKEIEIGEVNNWNDTSTKTFDKLNEKYIKAHNDEAIPDDGKGDFEVDGVHYWTVSGEDRYVYCIKGEFANQSLYRVDRNNREETCIASGVSGMSRNNSDGRISIYVNKNDYTIYELDKNIVFRHSADESIIDEVTNTTNNTVNTTTNNTANSTTNNVANNTVNTSANNTTNAVNNQKSQTTTNTIDSKADLFKDLQSKTYVTQKVEPENASNEDLERYTCDYTLKFISADNFSIQIDTKYKDKNVKIVIPNVEFEQTSQIEGDTSVWFNLVGYDENNKKYEGWGSLSVKREETPLLNLTITIKEDLFEGVNTSIQGERLKLENR